MNDKTESPIRRWHIIALLVGVWVIAAAILCFTWVIAHDMSTAYSVPGCLSDAVEPLILSGKDAEVLEYCEYHLAYHPDDIQARFYRAVALHRLGQEAEAEKEFVTISGINTNWTKIVAEYPAWLKSDARNMMAPQPED